MKKDIEYRLVNNKIDLSDGSEIKMDQKDKILLMKVSLLGMKNKKIVNFHIFLRKKLIDLDLIYFSIS